jgi:hypothetical protein
MVTKSLNLTREDILAELRASYERLPRLEDNEITAQMLAREMGWTYQKAQGYLASQGYKSRIVYDENDTEIMAYYKE